MQFRAAHFLLELRLDQDLAQDFIGRHQRVRVWNHHIVNPHQVVVAQIGVVEFETPCMHGVIQGEVHVVVEISASGDDPVHESSLDEWNNARAAQPGRGQGTGKTHTDSHIGFEHFANEELACLAQAGGVVGQENLIYQVSNFLFSVDVRGLNTLTRHVLLLVRAVLFFQPFRHFGNVLARTNVFFLFSHKIRV